MDDAACVLTMGMTGGLIALAVALAVATLSSTPTVLVLGPDGGIARWAVGLPRKADVLAALGSVIEPEAAGLPPWK